MSVKVHGLDVIQPVIPVQPAKVEPVAGIAYKVTSLPPRIEAEQVLPQLMPPIDEYTEPEPFPVLETDNV